MTAVLDNVSAALIPTPAALGQALAATWTSETSVDPNGWSERNRAWGQCAVTALLVQDLYGGQLIRGIVDGNSHYWNRLPDGIELDLTRGQFSPASTPTDAQCCSRTYVLSYDETKRRYRRLRREALRRLPSGGERRSPHDPS